MSLTVSEGVCVQMQSKFETLKSKVYPDGFSEPSYLFFVIQMKLDLLKNTKNYLMKKL
jgi:hypothetical protein